jgi:outer membrane protein OmpA-like peptidoglycan-associated protein
MSVAALAEEPKTAPPQEPAGFIAGGVVGGLAAGPVGAVVGAGFGTWLGNRVHRAGDARRAEARLAALESDKAKLQTEKAALLAETSDLTETNRALTARLDELSQTVDAAQAARQELAGAEAAKVLEGLQGDVLFRTGSAEIAPEMTKGIQVLADAVAKMPSLKVRVDGYADPRGTAGANLKLSEARADAVRDLLMAAGVEESSVEVNAYGKSRSIAADEDGYALERRVRLTLEADDGGTVAQSSGGASKTVPDTTATDAAHGPAPVVGQVTALKAGDKE